MLKRVALVGIAIALMLPLGVAGVLLWGQAASPAAAQSTESATGYSPAETITVVGLGSVSVRPDIARVSLGVETSAETIGEAVAGNEVIMESILAALEETGIDAKDIQTMNYSIRLDRYPEQLPRAGSSIDEPQPMYRVSNMVNVTIRDLDSVGNVLDAVIEAGANDIWGITFAIDEPSQAQDEARAGAIEDALSRAGALAELNGVALGPVMSVTEIVGSTPIPMPVALEKAAAGGGGPISPGELEIGYQVQVTYFIER
jgi:uncharacterized protein YggE